MVGVSQALERVLGFVDGSSWSYELTKARDEFFAEFDPSLISDEVAEFALSLFQDWFLFERELEELGVVPVVAFYREFSSAFTPEEDELFSALTRTVFGVFRLKKVKAESVALASLMQRKVYEVFDPVPEGFRTSGLISARLVELGGRHMFCSVVCFHPESQTESIVRCVESIRDEEEARKFLLRLARINLKSKLYPEVDPALFYRELPCEL